MRRATEKEIARLLKTWAVLRAARVRIEAKRDQKIAPLRARFEQKCAPFHAAAQKELTPVEAEMAEIEAKITESFLRAIHEPGKTSFRRVDTATAVAEVITREERELDPQVFFDSVPPAQRGKAFYSCLKTLISRAQDFLGKDRLNELCHAKQRHSVSIKTKEGV